MRFRNLVVCFSVSIAAFFTTSTHASEVGGNLSFENPLGGTGADPFSDPLNWFGFTGSGAVGVGTSDSDPLDGTFQAEISFAGSVNSFAGFQQVVPGITSGETYTFSVFAKTDGNLYDVVNELRIEWLNSAGDEVGRTENLLPIFTTDYVQYSQGGVAPADATQLRAVIAGQSFNGATGTGLARFDSASIQGPAVIPEPSSVALLGMSVFGWFGRRRRRS